MTDEIMKRANAFAEHQAKKHFPMCHQEQDRKTVAFIARISYLQGMEDTDAKRKLLNECENAFLEIEAMPNIIPKVELTRATNLASAMIQKLKQGGDSGTKANSSYKTQV